MKRKMSRGERMVLSAKKISTASLQSRGSSNNNPQNYVYPRVVPTPIDQVALSTVESNEDDIKAAIEYLLSPSKQSVTEPKPESETEIFSTSSEMGDKASALIAMFRCLEVIVYRLQSRGQLATWQTVCQQADHLYSRNITLEDLCLIAMVYPGAYTLDYHGVRHHDAKARAYQLTIQLPLTQTPASDQSTATTAAFASTLGPGSPSTSTTTSTTTSQATRHHRHTSRMETFIRLLEGWISRGQPLVPNMTFLPIEPDTSALVSDASNRVKQISREVQAKKVLEKISKEEEYRTFVSNGSIEGLRNLAVYRGELASKQSVDIAELEQIQKNKRRQESLPNLIRVLRRVCLQEQRLHKTVDSFVSDNAEAFGVDRAELRARLHLLAEACPEFIHISPPSDIIGIETFRVNMDCSVSSIQEKIKKVS